jgi:hypothetical protein
MSYRELYEFCQALTVPVSRNEIKAKVLALTRCDRVRVFRSTLDVNLVCGYYLSARNNNHRFVQQAGCCVIVVARDLNYCWERFVTLKELMHLFDDPLESTNSPIELEAVLADFGNATEQSPQTRSEWRCFWMAMGCMCPEELRVELQRKHASGAMTALQVAEQLKMPEKYVSALFSAKYKEMIAMVFSDFNEMQARGPA